MRLKDVIKEKIPLLIQKLVIQHVQVHLRNNQNYFDFSNFSNALNEEYNILVSKKIPIAKNLFRKNLALFMETVNYGIQIATTSHIVPLKSSTSQELPITLMQPPLQQIQLSLPDDSKFNDNQMIPLTQAQLSKLVTQHVQVQYEQWLNFQKSNDILFKQYDKMLQ